MRISLFAIATIGLAIAASRADAAGEPSRCEQLFSASDSRLALAATKAVAPKTGKNLSLKQIPLISRLPEDIKPLMLEALRQKIGHVVGPFTNEGFQQLKLSGLVSEREANELAGEVLENSRVELAKRTILIPDAFNIPRLGSVPVASSEMGLAKKYDLGNYDEILRVQNENKKGSMGVGLSLEWNLKLATESQQVEHAKEAVRHMIALSRFDASIQAAQAVNDQSSLIHIGLIRLAHYYSSGNSSALWPGHAQGAIDSLKRVSGPLRSLAVEILKDLARDLSDPSHIQASFARDDSRARAIDGTSREERFAMREQQLLGYALGAFRATAPVEAIWQDLNHTIYIGRIADPVVRDQIKALIKRIEEKNYRIEGSVDELGLAKAAVSGGSPFTRAATEALADSKRLQKNQDAIRKHYDPSGELSIEVVQQLSREDGTREMLLQNGGTRQESLDEARAKIQSGDGLNAIYWLMKAALLTPQ